MAESSATFNQAAAHDTGLYDPDRHDNKIVAMYENEERARTARDKLVSEGIPAGVIQIVDRSYDQYAGGVDYERNTGLWGAVKSLFMPDQDAHGYAEGVARGHSMLVVDPSGQPNRQRIIELLEGTDPLDFDAKLEEWRQAGYAYPGEQPAGEPVPTNASMATGGSAYSHSPHVTEDAAPSETIPVAAGDIVQHPTTPASTSQAVSQPMTQTAGTTAPVAPGMMQDAAPSTLASGVATTAGNEETLKVMEERLRVGKREVARGAVRVRSYIVERPVQQDVHLHEERVHVERRPVDRAASPADFEAFQERTIEVVAHAEEAVIAKEARVVEEIAIRKDSTDRVETVRDTVRRTEVEVEDTTADVVGSTPTPTTRA